MITTLTVETFDFDQLTDQNLRETFESWFSDNAPSAEWAELYAVGRAAIIEEAHRRASEIHKYEVEITSTGKNADAWRSAHSFGFTDVFTGTAAEFGKAFGLPVHGPASRHGVARGEDGNGFRIELTWRIV